MSEYASYVKRLPESPDVTQQLVLGLRGSW